MCNHIENFYFCKKNFRFLGNFGWGGRIRTSEMAGPKPAALPLGDAPIFNYILFLTKLIVNFIFNSMLLLLRMLLHKLYRAPVSSEIL